MNQNNIFDYSSILSVNSNKQETLSNESNLSLINIENLSLNLINSLNKELIEIGYESIYGSRQTDYCLLLKNSFDLSQRYRRQLSTIERLQDQNYKLDKENEFFLKRQQTLKDSIDNSSRNLNLNEEKYRQLQSKMNESLKNIKILTEENRRLQNNLEQRDKQFKNDRKKLEKEIEKLKDRIQTLTNTKNKELASIDLSDSIYKNHNGPRATWNIDNGNSKKQLELYSELIKDYDRKLKEIVIENNDLKTFTSKVFNDLDHLLDKKENSNQEDNKYQDVIQFNFDEVYKKLSADFDSKLKLINHLISNQTKADNTEKNDLTISTINSLNETINKTEISLNEKFIKQAKLNPICSSSSSISSSTSSDSKKEKPSSKLDIDLLKPNQKKIQVEQESYFKSIYYSHFGVDK